MKLLTRNYLWAITGILCGIGISGYLYTINVFGFLAPNAPIEAQVLVIEGWIPDNGMKIASDYITNTNYQLVIVTGGPLEHGSFLSNYKTYAEVGRATIIKLTGREDIVAASAPPVRKDRTYESALSLKKWLDENHIDATRINLISSGAHARRSWYLFRKALGDKYSIGIIAVAPYDYDGDRWWSYSAGFRSVVSETIGYLYALIIFPFTKEQTTISNLLNYQTGLQGFQYQSRFRKKRQAFK
jgi:hypothetical protein